MSNYKTLLKDICVFFNHQDIFRDLHDAEWDKIEEETNAIEHSVLTDNQKIVQILDYFKNWFATRSPG